MAPIILIALMVHVNSVERKPLRKPAASPSGIPDSPSKSFVRFRIPLMAFVPISITAIVLDNVASAVLGVTQIDDLRIASADVATFPVLQL